MHWTNARDIYTRRNLHTELVAVRSIGIVKYLHLSVYYAQFERRQFFFFTTMSLVLEMVERQ